MTHEEALRRVRGYLTDLLPIENYDEVEEIMSALEQQPCEDTISRQAAIDLVKDVCDAIMSCCGSHYDEETDDEVYDDIREIDAILKCNKEMRIALKNMPSAEPERKKGWWIRNDNGTYSCSLCHSWIPEEQYYYARFCLYCGADMRGEQDE